MKQERRLLIVWLHIAGFPSTEEDQRSDAQRPRLAGRVSSNDGRNFR